MNRSEREAIVKDLRVLIDDAYYLLVDAGLPETANRLNVNTVALLNKLIPEDMAERKKRATDLLGS